MTDRRHMDGRTGVVFNVQTYSIHDGPGIRTVVFFKGCPLSCLWCSNPESQRLAPELGILSDRCISCGRCAGACPRGAISIIEGVGPVTDTTACVFCGSCEKVCPYGARKIYGRTVSAGELMNEIEKDRPFYIRSGGGVTFSGGEPTVQYELLCELLSACRAKYIHTAIETCGYISERDKLDRLLTLVDLFLYDIKCIDDDKHRRCTGVSNELILRNARAIAAAGKEMIVRVPLIPGFNDTREDIEAIGDFVLSLISVREVNLLPYHELGKAKYRMLGREYGIAGPAELADEKVHEFRTLLEAFDLVCMVD